MPKSPIAVLTVTNRWIDSIHWKLFGEEKFQEHTLIVVSSLEISDSYFATFESTPKEMQGESIKMKIPKHEIICVAYFSSEAELNKQIGFATTSAKR